MPDKDLKLTQEEKKEDEFLFHRISDDELKMLCAMAPKDYWTEALWAMVGIAVGVAPTAVESIFNAFILNPSKPLTVFGLVHIVFLFVAVGIGIVVSRAMKNRPQQPDLPQVIRERTKHKLVADGTR